MKKNLNSIKNKKSFQIVLILFCAFISLNFLSCTSFNRNNSGIENNSTAVANDGKKNDELKNQVTNDSQSSAQKKNKSPYKPTESDLMTPRGIDFATAPSVIAFSSCANQDAPQPLWNSILKNNPDLFIFSGDNVYASKPETKPISEQYKKLNKIAEFRNFREKVPFLVTWDDHDYGLNDGGAENPEKEEAKKEFLNQWAYVKDSLRIKQEGVYHSKILGGVKKKSPTVQVILLDTRWFRGPLKKVADESNPLKKYSANDDKKVTFLGDVQWEWLEKQFKKPANVRILVSSIQFIAEEHGFEKWGNFPHEKQKLINMIKQHGVRNLFIISGDRHFGSIAKMDIKGYGPLFDITASSINKPKDAKEEDKSYLGPIYTKENFGLIKIDWSKKKILFELKDMDNNTVNKIEAGLR